MFTYDVVSESIRNPHELAAELTRRSDQGWEVVQIVFDGATWFHAFIRHEGRVGVAPFPGAAGAQSPEVASTGAPESVSAPGRTVAPVSTASAPPVTSTAPEPSASSAPAQTEPSVAPASATPAAADASVPEVPANWYKDPSGRFELRYWNGTAWTEHVATGGRQSVDPPKA